MFIILKKIFNSNCLFITYHGENKTKKCKHTIQVCWCSLVLNSCVKSCNTFTRELSLYRFFTSRIVY